LATDADSQLITAVAVTRGTVTAAADSTLFEPLVDRQAREVTADKGYDTNANHWRLEANGQRSSITIKKNRVKAPPRLTSRREYTPSSTPLPGGSVDQHSESTVRFLIKRLTYLR